MIKKWKEGNFYCVGYSMEDYPETFDYVGIIDETLIPHYEKFYRDIY